MNLTLDQACIRIVDCKNRTAPEDPDGEYFAVGTPAMRGNVINYDEARRINSDTFAEWTARMVPEEGDILFAREAPVGPVVAIPSGGRVAAGQRTMVLRANPSVAHPTYLRFYLSAPQTQERILGLAHGSTTPHLRVPDVKSFVVDLPDIDTQQAIAEVLGALDDKIAANAGLSSTAEAMAALIYEARTAGLKSQRMSDVLTPVLGGTPARSNADYWGGQNLWISAKDVTGAGNGVVIDTEETITDLAILETKAKPLPIGSVILTARGTVGAVARLGCPASFNQSCYGFVPGVTPAGVLYFAIRKATDQAKSLAHGSVFDTITMKTFDHLYMPDLSGSDSALLEAKLDPLLKSVAQVSIENRTLAATRDALLPQLMSGKLRVKDAEALVANAV